MLIIGAKGFAKEILEVLYSINELNDLVFYDDYNKDAPDFLYEKFPVLKNTNEVEQYFNKVSKKFTIGIGNPVLRKTMYDKITKLGGAYTSTISSLAELANFDVQIEAGVNILHGAIISNGVSVGLGSMIYYDVIITHDVCINKFVEISPSATLLGRCNIGSYTQIGSNVTILPDIVIGENVIVAAGAVVTKNVPSNCMVAGVPAQIKKTLTPLDL